MVLFMQLLLTFLCNVATFSFGLQLGWLAPLQPDLQSNSSSPLGPDVDPLTNDEISWIGAIPGIVTIFGAPLFGFSLDRLGRKISLLLCTAPNVVTYLLLIFADNVYYVYLSRAIGGVCSCGGLIIGSMYIIEAVHPTLRGTLGGMTAFSINLGVIVSFIFGSYTSYLALNLVSVSFTILFLVCFPFIPESPTHYMRTGRWEEAEMAFLKMWGQDEHVIIKLEMEDYRSFFKERKQSLTAWQIIKYLFVNKGARRGIITVAVVMGTEMVTGLPAIISYTVEIFMKSGTVFSPYLAAVLVAVFQLIFAFIGAFLIERLGRKGVLTYCGPVVFVSLAATSIYLAFRESYPDDSVVNALTILPTIAVITYISFITGSFGAVGFVIIPELFTPESRSTASTIVNVWYAFTEFTVVKLYPTLLESIGLSGLFGVYAVFASLGIIYVRFCMFETKGLSFKKIQSKLEGKYDTRL